MIANDQKGVRKTVLILMRNQGKKGFAKKPYKALLECYFVMSQNPYKTLLKCDSDKKGRDNRQNPL